MQRSLRARLDRVADALSPGSIRRAFQAAQRKLGITRSGQIALVGCVMLWVMARVVAGTAMYLFAYGLVLLVGLAYLIAPHKLRLTGTRDGLFPRAQEGDRLDVEVKLTASRRVGAFILEERVPERLGAPGRGPLVKLPSGETVTPPHGLREGLRDGYELRCETNGGPLVRPLRGAGSQLMLLDALARLELDRKPLSEVIMRLVTNARRDAHNVLITPRLGQIEAAQLKLLL